MTIAPGGALSIGRVAGAHGVRGALRVRLHDPKSTSLCAGQRVSFRDASGVERTCHEIERLAPKPGSSIVRLWLGDVVHREAAEALRGLELWVERESLAPLEHDEFYLADLVGRAVERGGPGQPRGDAASRARQLLGEIVGITSNGVQDLLEIRIPREVMPAGARAKIWLLPVLPQFMLEITPERVLVDVPEGMLPEILESVRCPWG